MVMIDYELMTDFYEESVGLMKWNNDDMLVTVFVQLSDDEVIFSQAA